MERILVGQIVNVHGIKGMVKVYPYTDEAERFYELEKVFVGDSKELISIQSISKQKNLLLVKFEGIEDRNRAEKLKNEKLYIPIEQRKELQTDEYFIEDLIGLNVFLKQSQEAIGKVVDFSHQVANDLLIIETENGQFMLPFLKVFIDKISLEEKTIYINTIEGMLP